MSSSKPYSQKKTSGDQFVNKVDMKQVCNNFLKFYYNTWSTNVPQLVSSPIWKHHTKININGNSVTPQQAVQFHQNFQGAVFDSFSHQFIPDGSRRLDILVKGRISKSGHSKVFVQSFALVELKGNFFIKSTQFYFI
jgi:hypothetical protein